MAIDKEKINFLVQAAQSRLINFCQLINPKFEVVWFHELLAEKLEEVLTKVAKKEKARLILTIPPRHGKQLADSTDVLTTKGWKKHGDLKLGDFVFSPAGEPVKIIWKSAKTPSNYVVTLSDGTEIRCHENHEWTVYDRVQRKVRTMETNQILKQKYWSGNRSRFQLPPTQPVEFKEQYVAIHPYLLGVWLGDGSYDKTAITYDKDDNFWLNKVISLGYNIGATWVHKDTGVLTTQIKGVRGYLSKYNLLRNKHIPDEYKYNSVAVRLELLAGLIDTDGHLDKKGRYRIATVSKKLADDIFEVASSLGFRPYTMVQKPHTSSAGIIGRRNVYYVGFNTDRMIPCVVPRKICNKLTKQKIIGIKNIRFSPNGEKGNCIMVDSEDGLYLVTKRLIPTHNTQLASIYFPAWALGKYPQLKFIFATYGSELAEKVGLDTRDIISSDGYQAIYPGIELRQDVKAKAKWMTNKKGSYTLVGAGAGITGQGGDVIIVDDLLKSREEAESESVSNFSWEYYRSTLYSRLEGYGAVIIIMQRWNQKDIVARLLEEEEKRRKAGEQTEDWEIINFPAIAEEDEYVGGKLVRKEGEPLWPSKFPVPVLDNIRQTLGLYNFQSQYQQNPIAVEMQEFKEKYFKYFEEEDLRHRVLKYYTFVDPAISQKKNADNTVVLTVAKDVNGPNWYRVREDAGHFTPSQTVDLVMTHQMEYRSAVYIETVQYQMALKYAIIEEQKRLQRYFPVNEIKTQSNKETRIRGLIPLYEAGVIYHRKSDLEYEKEALTFPRGRHDDRIDCMSFILLTDHHGGGQFATQFKKKFTGYFRPR